MRACHQVLFGLDNNAFKEIDVPPFTYSYQILSAYRRLHSMSGTPQVVRLIYACYRCNEVKSEGRNLRLHLLTEHEIEVPAMKRGQRHRDTKDFVFVKSTNSQIPERFACPSCLIHFGDTEDFRTHVAKHTKQTDATTIILNKRSNINSVQVFSSKIGPSRAEILAERATELNDLVAIGQREALLTNLSTLRQYPFLAIFIQGAIKEDIDTLPLFIWSYSTNNAAPHELKLIRAAKFMFTRFVDTCTSAVPPFSTSKRDHKRTFWVRYIVPIFETFSNQTGLLQMNWCEIPMLSIDEDKLVDGKGYDHWGFERVALEGSSGLSNASSDKISDDATKQISTLISMMKRIASHHLNSDVQSFINTKVYGIQSVNSTVILSEVRFLVNGKYEYKEIRSAQVPTIYGERNRWPKIFEILCYLEMELQKQKLVYEIMENEEQGLITVLPASSRTSCQRTLSNSLFSQI